MDTNSTNPPSVPQSVPPSVIVTNGRTSSGRFAKGWKGGPGNPHAQHVNRLRNVLMKAVTREDMRVVIAKLIELAKAGTPWAVRELFDRVYGKPKMSVDITEHGTVLQLVEQIIDHDPTDNPVTRNPAPLLPQ